MKPVLSVKLKNLIKKEKPEGNFEFFIRNIVINDEKRGCSGFIRNKDNNSVVYVTTEECCGMTNQFMCRYADHIKDFTGYRNRWGKGVDRLIDEIIKLLEAPVSQTNDIRM